jgi:transcriptional regulator with XRE-family HTH domain
VPVNGPRNIRLRERMRGGGWTNEKLAEAAGVDPKTVDRWINSGRIPHRRTALRTARILGTDPHELWPALARGRNPPEAPMVRTLP